MAKKKIDVKGFREILVQTGKEWYKDEPFMLAAALSYYAVISLPAMLLIVVITAGTFYGQEAISGRLAQEMSTTIGPRAAETVEKMIAEVTLVGDFTWMIVVSVAVILFSATSLFFQLQLALNKIWKVRQRADVSWTKLFKDRSASLGLVLGIGFILLVSLVLSAILTSFSEFIISNLGENLDVLLPLANFVLSIVFLTFVFAMMYKVLPDVDIDWKDVWVGAGFTAVLFTISKFLLGLYFSNSDPASSYGAAGSVVLIMLWVSYNCLVVIFGAEFTQVYAHRYGKRIRPSSHAYRYRIIEETVDVGEDEGEDNSKNELELGKDG